MSHLVILYRDADSEPVRHFLEDLQLKTLQREVGGYIEAVRFNRRTQLAGLTILCDEDGISKDLPMNRIVGGHFIHGTFIVVAEEGEDFRGLTELEAAKTIVNLR